MAVDQSRYNFRDVGTQAEITDASLEFLSKYTGEADFSKLREHVHNVWSEARAKYHVYRCIQSFMFLQPRTPTHPKYAEIVAALAKPSARSSGCDIGILDIGCCFGTDVRRFLYDGVPADLIVASDLHSGYWNLGKLLFQDEERISNLRTDFGDWAAVSDDIQSKPSLSSTATSSASPSTPRTIDVSRYESRAQYISAMAVLHVFSRSQCEAFVKNVFKALASGVGATLFGTCCGRPTAEEWAAGRDDNDSSDSKSEADKTTPSSTLRYLHSPDSLKSLFESVGFVDVVLTSVDRSAMFAEAGLPSEPDNAVKLFMEFSARKP